MDMMRKDLTSHTHILFEKNIENNCGFCMKTNNDVDERLNSKERTKSKNTQYCGRIQYSPIRLPKTDSQEKI